jgi:hypothetical protein
MVKTDLKKIFWFKSYSIKSRLIKIYKPAIFRARIVEGGKRFLLAWKSIYPIGLSTMNVR